MTILPGGESITDLTRRARTIRSATVRMAHGGRTPHVASALSCVEILVALYFRIMRIGPDASPSEDRDRFILSKGHGCMSYYATLAERGYFSHSLLATYATNGSRLAEHPSPQGVPGIEVATGSLGHGLAFGAGLTLAGKIDGRAGRTFVLLSDGECDEGTVWEAAMFSAAQRLDNLIAIVDYNKLQAMGRSTEITALEPFADKWRAFGWATREVSGHDLGAIVDGLEQLPWNPGQPSVLIAHTVKGKGVSFMEDEVEWHYRPPSDDDLARALDEIGA